MNRSIFMFQYQIISINVIKVNILFTVSNIIRCLKWRLSKDCLPCRSYTLVVLRRLSTRAYIPGGAQVVKTLIQF